MPVEDSKDTTSKKQQWVLTAAWTATNHTHNALLTLNKGIKKLLNQFVINECKKLTHYVGKLVKNKALITEPIEKGVKQTSNIII